MTKRNTPDTREPAEPIEPKIKRSRGRPLEKIEFFGQTKLRARTAMEIVRTHGAPLEVLCEMKNMILKGHGTARLAQTSKGEWYATYLGDPDGPAPHEMDFESSPEAKREAIQYLTVYGYGMPVQQHLLESKTTVEHQVNFGTLSGESAVMLAALLSKLRPTSLDDAGEPAPALALPASTIHDIVVGDVSDEPIAPSSEPSKPGE